MAIGTSLGAYFDDEFHHQAGINTDPSQDHIDVDPEVDDQSTKPKPKLDIMKVSDTPDYDYEAYQKAFPGKEITPDSHGPDTFKLPNHITFSNESMYHSDATPGGQWGKQDDGSWTFTPSSFNLQQHSGEELKDYFDKYEKGNKLILPDNAAGMASQASEKAADALKSARGTLPTSEGDLLPNIEDVPHHDTIEDIGKSIYKAVTLPGDVYKGKVDLSSNEGIERTIGLAQFGLTPSATGAISSELKAAMGSNNTGSSVVEKLVPKGSQAELDTALHEGPSPFEQVASAARRARPEDETDRALRSIHEALYPESRTTADREATASDLFRQEGHESFDDLMSRLDRQDQARMDATPASNFKDYGKVSVADRGYGSFLFKAGDSKVLPLRVSERENGKLLYVNWIGDQTGQAVNTFDKGTIKGLFKALAEKYPNAEEVAGFRVSGARAKAGATDVARMKIPGRGKISPPRKDIDQLLNEWNGSDNTFGGQ